jgi:hypothetical protein
LLRQNTNSAARGTYNFPAGQQRVVLGGEGGLFGLFCNMADIDIMALNGGMNDE